jgi:hypothetical protein
VPKQTAMPFYERREPKDVLGKTIDQVRGFLRSHQPVTAGR